MNTEKIVVLPLALGALVAVCFGCDQEPRGDSEDNHSNSDDDDNDNDDNDSIDTDTDTGGDADSDSDADTDTDGYDSDSGQDTGSDTGSGCDASGNGYWTAASASIECEVFELTNYHRTHGADCPGGKHYEPTAPFVMHPLLQKAARDYSAAMASNGTCGHYSDGMDPQQRVAATGYQASTGAENVACDQITASQVVGDWMASGTHCPNIMNPNYTEIGIGYSKSGTTYWVQEFAKPK